MTAERRVIAINLDAFDFDYARRLMAVGKLTGLSRLAKRAARFDLKHGPDNGGRDTGRTGEHISVGLKPESTGLWAPFLFRPDDYSVVQKFTPEVPYANLLSKKTVVFDPTYFDLTKCPDVDGIVGWSGHDPGAHPYCRPATLATEIDERFGKAVLDKRLLHCNVYPDVELTETFAQNVVKNVRKRFEIIEWMISERFTDWEYALLSIEESHDAIEHLYFGIDSNHPYAHLESVPAALAGMESIYEAISDGVESLADCFPDADFVIFTMHGMGPNRNDTPSMILLPELLFRVKFRERLFDAPPHWTATKRPILSSEENWFTTIFQNMKPRPLRKLRRVPSKVWNIMSRALGAEIEPLTGAPREKNEFAPLYVPGAHYRRYWPQMRAFALPSLHNGIIRFNVKGRERNGFVDPAHYVALQNEVEGILRECVDTATGGAAVHDITRPGANDPFAVNDSQGDLVVHWNELIQGISHPEYGAIGPLPIWRTGGHTGAGGGLLIITPDLEPGEYGERSSYDVAPTIVELVEGRALNRMDGESLLDVVRRRDLASA